MEKGIIKGNKTTYFKKSENKTVETISKYVNLGVNSCFSIDDDVVILSETDYNKLMKEINTDAVDEIDKLNETIAELNKQITKLTNDNDIINNKLSTKQQEINKLNNIITDKDNELNKYNDADVDKLNETIADLTDDNKELLETLSDRQTYIIYLEQMQTDYKDIINYHRNKNILTPLLNAIGLSDIDKPQLKHLDIKGNKLTKTNEPILTKGKETETHSE